MKTIAVDVTKDQQVNESKSAYWPKPRNSATKPCNFPVMSHIEQMKVLSAVNGFGISGQC